DLIKAAVGQDYTVALNLASTTPSWLTAIGATPMKQGLDLRGGVHFLLQVDIDSVLARRYEGMKKNLIQDMHEAKIHFSSIRDQIQQGILIGFRDSNTYNDALKLLRQQHSDLVLVKRDAQMRILVSLSPGELK